MRILEQRLSTQRFRRQAIGFVALFMVTNLWSFLHTAAVQHARCAEHGELIHTASTETEAGPAVLVTLASDATRSAPRPADDDAHDHCCLGISSSAAGDLCWTSPHLIGLVPVPDTRRMPAERYALASIAAYELAPKNSPPS